MLLPLKDHLKAKKIILASSSPRRKQLLTDLGLVFEILPSTFEENLDKAQFSHAWQYVSETSYRKALDVHQKLVQKGQAYDLIISADTIVVLNDKIVEKPSSPAHAHQILRELSDAGQHSVFTALTLFTTNSGQRTEHRCHEETFVKFAPLTDQVIASYVQTGIPMDKAGGYGIQDALGGSLISAINGCYYNVVGLPIHLLCKEITRLCAEKLL